VGSDDGNGGGGDTPPGPGGGGPPGGVGLEVEDTVFNQLNVNHKIPELRVSWSDWEKECALPKGGGGEHTAEAGERYLLGFDQISRWKASSFCAQARSSPWISCVSTRKEWSFR
jgi:hypothetical protein